MKRAFLPLVLLLALPAGAVESAAPEALRTLLVVDPLTSVYSPAGLHSLKPGLPELDPALARLHSEVGYAAMVEGAPAAQAALHADLKAQPALIQSARNAAFASLVLARSASMPEVRQSLPALSERYRAFFDGVAANPALPESVRVEAKEVVIQLARAQERRERASSPVPALPAGRYAVETSQPSVFGKLMRLVWPAHTLIRVRPARVSIDPYLPSPLKEFPQENPSALTKLKKTVLFSRPVVAVIRLQLAKTFKPEEGGRTERQIFDALPVHTDAAPGKYNIVIEPGVIGVMKLDHDAKLLRFTGKFLDWILAKHVLMSGYSRDVRFAGEVWKGADGAIHLSNNSGTYRPSSEQLARAVAYLSAVFPNTKIVAEPAGLDAPSAPAPQKPKKDLSDFKMELRRKLIHQKNWGYLLGFLLMGYPLTPLVFAGFTALVATVGYLRLHNPLVRDWWAKRFGSVMRPRESTQMSGFFYGALGMTVTTALFGWSKPLVAAAAMAYVLGDAISPLVGKRFGWKPFKVAGAQRSLDGALASFTAMLLIFLALGFPALVALGGALVFSCVDLYPVKPDDNLWNPIAVSAALFLFSRLAGFPL